MKKYAVLALFAVLSLGVSAQQVDRHIINSFFNADGSVRFETQELDQSADTLASIFHRADDVIWARVVYRIIDMRYKQNYQLYFPTNPEDQQYHSLYYVILDALAKQGTPKLGAETWPVLRTYDPLSETTIKPYFDDSKLIDNESLIDITAYGERNSDPPMDEDDFNYYGLNEQYPSYDAYVAELTQNSVQSWLVRNPQDSTKLVFQIRQAEQWQKYVRNQLKYLIQEIVFFDKHYSRLYTKIIAIAPLYATQGLEGADDPTETSFQALRRQIMWWMPYDQLRYYMARQYMIPQANETKRVTFEQFFAQKLYSSYLVGESDMYDRLLLNYAEEHNPVRPFVSFSRKVEEGQDPQAVLDTLEAQRAALIAQEKNYPLKSLVGPARVYTDSIDSVAVMLEEYKVWGPYDAERKARMEKDIKKEQQRIQDELMNFEIDLWEY